ncbi:MAG: GNAT family N-acetyltransferase, partial [Pirellulaceae bacterium]
DRFRAVVVEDGNTSVAALPMVERRWARVIRTGATPCNEWSLAGDLLLDTSTDGRATCDCLAAGINQLRWPLLRLSYVRTDAPAWLMLRESLSRAGLAVECRPSYDVTYIETPTDWEAYRRSWSKNQRHRLGGRLRRLREQGDARLQRAVPATSAETTRLLDLALDIEDRGWKGQNGTSVLRTDGMREYLLRLADQLVPRGELEFAFLELDQRPIAFEILLHAKGVLHSYKVGYDEQFEWYDPGHLLMHELLHESCATQRVKGYDCFGPNTVGLRRWRGSIYQIGQLIIAPSRWTGQAAMFTYRHLRATRRPADVLNSATAPDSVEPDSGTATKQPAAGAAAE